MGVTSRTRAALENVDVAAATFVVGTDLIACDFLSIQEAKNNAPPEGADIYVLPGTYTQSSALLSAAAPISIRGSGQDVTILDFGSVAGKFISIDHDAPVNLLNLTVWVGGVAGQYLYGISTNYLASQPLVLENVMVGKFSDTTKSIEGGFLGSAIAYLTNVVILVQNTANSYFADSGVATPGTNYFACFNVQCTGIGVTRQKWGGFKNSTRLFASQCLFGCANFGSLGYVNACDGTSFVGGGTTSTITASNFSIFNGAYFNDVALVPASDVSIVGCLSGIIYTAAERIVDIPTGVDGVAIVGCSFASWTVETIRNDGTNVTVSGCVGYVTGRVKVTETTNANDNNYWDIDAASTIVGTRTRVNGSKLNAFSTVTTNAFVTALGPLVNPKGFRGSGVIKNTGANSMDVKELFTDAFGTVSTLTTTVAAGNELQLSLSQNIGTGRPPYVSYEVQVKDTVGGSHTTPALEFNSQGAML